VACNRHILTHKMRVRGLKLLKMYCIIIYVQHKICFSLLHFVWHTYLYYTATDTPLIPSLVVG